MSNVKSVYISFVTIFLIFCLKSAAGTELKNGDRQFIENVEAKLVLPAGSHKLQDYMRYYKIFGSDANSKIKGVFLFEDGVSGVNIVKKGGLPKVLDGGCDVVNVIFTRAGKIISVQCNGKA